MSIFNWGSKETSEVKAEDRMENVSQEITVVEPARIEEIKQPVKMIRQDKNAKFIHKDMTIGEAVRLYPDTVPVMLENGIHCVGCHVAHWETIEQGFRGHYGMNDEKLADFISQLNEVVESNLKKEMVEK